MSEVVKKLRNELLGTVSNTFTPDEVRELGKRADNAIENLKKNINLEHTQIALRNVLIYGLAWSDAVGNKKEI